MEEKDAVLAGLEFAWIRFAEAVAAIRKAARKKSDQKRLKKHLAELEKGLGEMFGELLAEDPDTEKADALIREAEAVNPKSERLAVVKRVRAQIVPKKKAARKMHGGTMLMVKKGGAKKAAGKTGGAKKAAKKGGSMKAAKKGGGMKAAKKAGTIGRRKR